MWWTVTEPSQITRTSTNSTFHPRWYTTTLSNDITAKIFNSRNSPNLHTPSFRARLCWWHFVGQRMGSNVSIYINWNHTWKWFCRFLKVLLWRSETNLGSLVLAPVAGVRLIFGQDSTDFKLQSVDLFCRWHCYLKTLFGVARLLLYSLYWKYYKP